jgi:trans-aconitate 2-methyltransferase
MPASASFIVRLPDSIQTPNRRIRLRECTLNCVAEWNAERYHQISSPQQAWGRKVLDRLQLQGRERVLDVGCGTGRVTGEIAARVPHGGVVGLDYSQTMLDTAQMWLAGHAPRVRLVRGDAASLPFRRAFDAVFSGATFHWVHDHAALFRSIITALRPGGRLVAQCGGGPNLALLFGRAARLMREPRFAPYFDDWTDPAYYSDAESAARRMRAAGFVDVETSLEAAPTAFDSPMDFQDFIMNVCVRHHVARLPNGDRQAFLRELTVAAAGDTPPLTLDYWRLNVAGRRPA